jgi:hypothetical protein
MVQCVFDDPARPLLRHLLLEIDQRRRLSYDGCNRINAMSHWKWNTITEAGRSPMNTIMGCEDSPSAYITTLTWSRRNCTTCLTFESKPEEIGWGITIRNWCLSGSRNQGRRMSACTSATGALVSSRRLQSPTNSTNATINIGWAFGGNGCHLTTRDFVYTGIRVGWDFPWIMTMHWTSNRSTIIIRQNRLNKARK